GVLTGAESIVTHPLVDDVCCTRVRSDVENANCAAERAWLVWTASGSASITSSIRRHIVLKTFIAQLLSVEDGRNPAQATAGSREGESNGREREESALKVMRPDLA